MRNSETLTCFCAPLPADVREDVVRERASEKCGERTGSSVTAQPERSVVPAVLEFWERGCPSRTGGWRERIPVFDRGGWRLEEGGRGAQPLHIYHVAISNYAQVFRVFRRCEVAKAAWRKAF